MNGNSPNREQHYTINNPTCKRCGADLKGKVPANTDRSVVTTCPKHEEWGHEVSGPFAQVATQPVADEDDDDLVEAETVDIEKPDEGDEPMDAVLFQ